MMQSPTQGQYSGSGFSYRQGRTYYVPGKKDTSAQTICLSILFVIFLIACPLILFYAEFNFALLVASITEVAPDVIDVDNPHQVPWHGKKYIHTTGMINYDAEVVDEAFHVKVNPALILNRKTEYCQWMEHRHEECQTCSEEGEDGKTHTYQCNCIIRYEYTKQWSSFRINSLLFDQPGAHYNPQRDPFPSQKFVSQNAEVNGFSLKPALVNNLKAQTFYVDWNDFAQKDPHWYDSVWSPVQKYFGFQKTHYRLQSELNDVRSSVAAREHAFFYIGQGGYFFSPYTPSQSEMVLKWAMQGLEGSLLDWQIGDFFGCTPGDIRVSYSTQFPPMVSVIGQSNDIKEIGLINAQDGRMQLGLLQEGDVDIENMLEREVNDEKSSLWNYRVFFSAWSAVVGDALLLYFGVVYSPLSLACATMGVWGTVLSLFEGYADYSVSFSVLSSFLYFLFFIGVLVATVACSPKTLETKGAEAVMRRYKWMFQGEWVEENKKGKVL
uniref:Uncharacterized protein n=1 Tax=Paramoeba aestuarina TaxID=180227 RepID=A0A7S4N4X2_9EUKA|mmetsp:Transcript_10730/g.16171  ORF Transcript_10730/g.16171 Transcript_10730/m.16171 type:complete len:495 (+) Transcript_10730:41-1525(+)